jgi:hypothetical protein
VDYAVPCEGQAVLALAVGRNCDNLGEARRNSCLPAAVIAPGDDSPVAGNRQALVTPGGDGEHGRKLGRDGVLVVRVEAPGKDRPGIGQRQAMAETGGSRQHWRIAC